MALRDFERLVRAVRASAMTVEKARAGIANLAWPQCLRQIEGATMGDLPEPEQVHPKRLLAELAEEFDRTR